MKLLCILLILTSSVFASEVKIEPVYGVERTQREFPSPARYKTTTFIGMRALYGVPAFSLELELNQSNAKEDFPEQNLEVEYKTQKALFGFRSYALRTSYLGWFIRLGARAEKRVREITENGEDRTEEDPINYDPYAGTGLTLVAGKFFALNAGATLIYNKNAEDESEKYDTRYTFSFTIKAKSK